MGECVQDPAENIAMLLAMNQISISFDLVYP